MSPHGLRRTATVIGAVLVVWLLATLGFLAFLAAPLPQTTGRWHSPFLDDGVRLIRDRHGVPHIFADQEPAAYYALGVAHAQDRLWQMDLFRRVARGRLSEIFGARTLRSDLLLRLRDLPAGAQESVAALPAGARAALDAYAAGINETIARTAVLPPEFLLLGARPEPWRPVDSLLVARLLALRLTANLGAERLNIALVRRLPPGRLASLFADWPQADEDWFRTVAAPAAPAAAASRTATPESAASNVWALPGARTASGKPLLANDPHLGLAAPAQWYLARLVIAGREITGATAPGMPFHVLGQNGAIAWGATSVGADLEDLFVERVDPADPGRYLTPGGSRPFAVRSLEIALKGGEQHRAELRVTRHGPVISDIDPVLAGAVSRGHVLALASAGRPRADTSLATAYGLAQARDWAQARRALRAMVAPVLNFHVASIDGAVASKIAGVVPLRHGPWRGVLPVPGWTGSADWAGPIAFDALPEVRATGEGALANANNRPDGADGAPLISHSWHAPLRQERLRALLAARPLHDLDSLQAIQNDAYAPDADLLLPLLDELESEDGRIAAALELLRAWDRRMVTHSPAAAIYATWTRELVRVLFADELGDLFPAFWSHRTPLLARHLSSGSPWCDDVSTAGVTETCAIAMEDALRRALAALAERFGDDMVAWRWGELHRATLSSPLFSRLPGIAWLADLSVPTDGSFYTINRGAGPISAEPLAFPHNHGAGYRAIYDLADPAASRYVLATGQSGHPLSRHWGDMVDLWRRGEMIMLAGSAEELRAAGGEELLLVPSR